MVLEKDSICFLLVFMWMFFSQLNLKPLYSLYTAVRIFILKSCLISKARANLPSIIFFISVKVDEIMKAEKQSIFLFVIT